MNVKNDLQAMQQLFQSQQVAAGNMKTRNAVETDAAASDQTTVSSAGSLAAKASAGSDVRMDKVSQVQQAIAAGTYNVPSSEVAGKMISQMLEK